jgi:hypothetical protein
MSIEGPSTKVFNSSFPYRPLGKEDWIRLVLLLPSCDGGEIECDIKTFTRKTCPSYEALSYVWGNLNNRSPIQVSGATFEVTENLKSALLHLRLDGSTRVLWIDAICINQLDLDELGQQVGIMSSIYSEASRTVVWLGVAKDESVVALRFFGDLAIEHLESNKRGDSLQTGSLNPNQRPYPLPFSDHRVVAVRMFLNQPWFTRIWVAQEVGVATKAVMVCGRLSLDWDLFHLGYEIAKYKDLLASVVGAADLERIDTLSFAKETKKDLLELLIKFRTWRATNPRDKVFALYGLSSSDIVQMRLLPDYTIDPAELWKRVARAFIRISGNLDIFSGCRGDQLDSTRIPSWAPNWNEEWPHAQTLHVFQETELTPNAFRASGGSKASVFVSDDDRALCLMGHVTDKIVQLGDVHEMRDDLPVTTRTFLASHELFLRDERIALEQAEKYPTGEDHMAVYWQTLAAGQMFNTYEETEEEFNNWYQALRVDRSMQNMNLNRIPIISDTLTLTGFFLNRAITPSSNFAALTSALFLRRLARTKNSYLSLVPAAARISDSIAICKGGGRPLVIRPHGDSWGIIGECYVHGIMNGQAYDEAKCRRMRFI